jgi:hypothetical protein
LFRETNVEALVEVWDWLGVAGKVAEDARFVHFDLIFADILKARGGFDIIVGNPPWAKPSWNEADVIGDIDPLFVVRKLTANESRGVKSSAINSDNARSLFATSFVAAKGTKAITSSDVMNPFAGGGSNNIYRCFVDIAFRLVAQNGSIGLIHEDGHLSETKGGIFRRSWYSRICKHFNFSNQITAKNFSEVHHTKIFSLNVYRGTPSHVRFDQFTNAFLAAQVEDSYRHDGVGKVPGIKLDGKWDTRGHRNRIIKVDESVLELAYSQHDDSSPKDESPVLYQFLSNDVQDVFISASSAPLFGSSEIVFQSEPLYHESGAQDAGIIRKQTGWINDAEDIVFSSPVLFVGNPLSKSPRRNCRIPQDYDSVDLLDITEDYWPRTNFQPAKGNGSLLEHTPACEWDKTKRHVGLGFKHQVQRLI